VPLAKMIAGKPIPEPGTAIPDLVMAMFTATPAIPTRL
jgi:hypothetical protein